MAKNVHESHPAWKIQPSPPNPVTLHVVALRWGVAESWILTTCWGTGTTSTHPSHCAQREVSSDLHGWSAHGYSWRIMNSGAFSPLLWSRQLTQYDDDLYVSTWLDHRMPRHVVKPCFWKRLAFALAQGIKQEALPRVGGHHSFPRGSKQNKTVQEGWILSLTVCMLSEDISPLLPSDQDSHHWFPCFLGLWTLSELDHHFPGSPACRRQIVGLLCLHNCVSQFLILYYLPAPTPTPDCFCFFGES